MDELGLFQPYVFAFQIDALSEIVDTVQGRIEVYLDGGIRTGSDVLKALALGAKCVFIGRPAVWGLAYKVGHPSLCGQEKQNDPCLRLRLRPTCTDARAALTQLLLNI